MISKTIKYTDYNGVERTETHWFNMNETELMMFRMSYPGGMDARLQQIIDAKSDPDITQAFEDIIRRSYGVKDADGRRFRKSNELFEDFKQTEAYNVLIMELLGDPNKATAFIQGILPTALRGVANKAIADSDATKVVAIDSPVTAP